MTAELRLLLVEENLADARRVDRALLASGIAFVTARVETALEFQSRLREFRPDLILAAFTLTGFGGPAVFRLAQAGAPAIPLIFLAETMDEERAIETLRLGAADYVLQGQLSRLALSIRRALDEGRLRAERRLAEKNLQEANDELRAQLRNRQEEQAAQGRVAREVYEMTARQLTEELENECRERASALQTARRLLHAYVR